MAEALRLSGKRPWHKINVMRFSQEHGLEKTLEAEILSQQCFSGMKTHDGREKFVHSYRVVQILIYHIERSGAIGKLISLEELDIILSAAFLHDVLEDVDWDILDCIERRFGEVVALLVWVLSRDKKAFSDKIHFARIADFNFSASIKNADRLHNLRNMTKNLGRRKFTKKRLRRQISETWRFIIMMNVKTVEQYPEYKSIIDEMHDELMVALAEAEWALLKA